LPSASTRPLATTARFRHCQGLGRQPSGSEVRPPPLFRHHPRLLSRPNSGARRLAPCAPGCTSWGCGSQDERLVGVAAAKTSDSTLVASLPRASPTHHSVGNVNTEAEQHTLDAISSLASELGLPQRQCEHLSIPLSFRICHVWFIILVLILDCLGKIMFHLSLAST
jgi:hypothetical protein